MADKLEKLFKELKGEVESSKEVKSSLQNIADTLTDQNQEMIATYVEGTKRLINKQKDISPDIKSLENTTKTGLQEVDQSIINLKGGIGEVERAVKNIKLPSNTDFRATGAMLKLPIKELTRSVQGFRLPTEAKDAIPVRLSDGKEFYKALETFIQQVSGGGGTSYAFDKQDSSPTKAATVAITIDGKSRDVIAVANPDGTSIGSSSGGGTEYTEDAAAPSNPVGPMTMLVRVDSPATLVSNEGDNIAGRATNYGAALVQLTTSTGSFIDSVGGGTQYTEGDTDATITGTAVMWEDGSNTLRAASAAKPLPVDIISIAAGTNAIGKVGHDITGIGHGVATVTTAGTDVALAGSTACKKVTIQAQSDNTSIIAVGGSGVDATVATGTGIVLSPGDVFELEIDNLADVFIDSLVNGEGVRFTYFT